MEIINVKNNVEGGKVAAEILVNAICLKPSIVLGLATGSSPESTYDALVESYRRGGVSFEYVKTVNLDEYIGLPKSSPQSYHYFMWKNLFSRVNIKAENTHIPNGMAENPEEECKKYDIMSCVECGSCTYGCPGAVPIVQLIRSAKVRVKTMK